MNKSIGRQLKAAREAKQMTISEVAFHLKTKTSVVEALEKEEFHQLAAPIYVRGFLRKYAELVGLSPNELVDIFNRHFLPEMQKKLNPSISTKHTIKSKEVPIIQPAISPIIPPEKDIEQGETFLEDAQQEQQKASAITAKKNASLLNKIFQKISQPSFKLPEIKVPFERLTKLLYENLPVITLGLLIVVIAFFFFIKGLKVTQTERSTLLAHPPAPYLDSRQLSQE